jgi:membrane protein
MRRAAVSGGRFAGQAARGAGALLAAVPAALGVLALLGSVQRAAPPPPRPPADAAQPVHAAAPAAVTRPLGWRGILDMIKRSVVAWIEDDAPSLGAALSYYSVFSLAPLLLIVVSVAGLVFGAEAARGEVFGQIRGLLGDEGAAAIEGLLDSVKNPGGGVVSTIVGVVLMLAGATTVFGQLQNALDRIWRSPERPAGGLWALLRTRLLSFGLILGLGFLLMVSLVLSAGMAAAEKWWAPALGDWQVTAQVLSFALSFTMTALMFAAIYKIMPRVPIAWSDVWVGAAVTAALFSVGRVLISLYIGHSAVASGFGAAGSLVVVLVWVYYSAQVFLLGAEFTWVYAYERGSKRGQTPPAPALVR